VAKRAAKNPKSSFGELLYIRRGQAKLTQEGLAEKSHLHRDFISKLENGRRMPSIKTLSKLAPPLNLTPIELHQLFLSKLQEEGIHNKWVLSKGQ